MFAMKSPRVVAWWAVLLAVAGCAAQPETREQTEVEESLADILSQPLDQDEYGTPRRCVSSFAYRDFQPLGDRYLVFDGPGDKLWLNELRGHCPGLAHAHALAFELRGNQICDLDRFKISDVFHWSRYRRWPWDWLEGIPCTLGKFQPVTREQVDAMRGALNSR